MIAQKSLNMEIEILKNCWEAVSPVFFSADLVDIVFETRLLNIDKNSILLVNNVPLQYITKVVQSKNFYLQAKMLTFKTSKISTDGKDIIFYFQESQIKENVRKSERVYFSVDENITCEFINPYDNETVLSKTIIDMSSDGVAIKNNYNSQLFVKGLKIDNFKILINGSLYMQRNVEVMYIQKLWDYAKTLKTKIGLKFLD